MKRNIIGLCVLVGLLCSSLLFSYQLRLPRTINEFQDLTVELVREQGDQDIEAARFYFYEADSPEPLFIELRKDSSLWKGVVPGIYIQGDRLVYFAEYLGADDEVYSVPETGTLISLINPDDTPPELKIMLPRSQELRTGMPQTIIFHAEDDGVIDEARVAVNGKMVERVEITGNIIKAIYTPESPGALDVTISVSDLAGNTAEQTYNFMVTGRERGTFVQAGVEYFLDAEVVFSASSAQEGHEIPGELMDNLEYDVEAGFTLGAAGEVRLGPLSAAAMVVLSDAREITEYLDVYPSVLVSDFHDIMRLWHPWNFANEFAFTEANVRRYESGNIYYAEIALFRNIVSYRFGNQSIHFQDQTISNMNFKGTSLHLDIPLLAIRAAKGFTDMGLKEQTWPRNFVGIQAGLDVFDYFYLQTNVSIISDFQGRFSNLSSTGRSDIGILFGLAEYDQGEDTYEVLVDPVSNIIIGVGTGLNLPWFELKGEMGLSLYVSNAGELINLDGLADFLAGQIDGFDLKEYTGYIDTVEQYFPVLDYFPLNIGIGTSFLDKNLWGVTYGGEFSVPPMGLSGFFRKTDSSYRSLGASLSTDSMEFGGQGVFSIGPWRLTAGYTWSRNNIPDILYHDIMSNLSYLDDDLLGYFESGDPGVAVINHKGDVKLQTPNFKSIGRFSGEYQLVWKTTNYNKFDDALSSHNESFVHTGSASWRSPSYRFAGISVSLGTKTKNSYTLNVYVDGKNDPADFESTEKDFWNFSAEASGRAGFSIFSFAPSYKLDWSTRQESVVKHTGKASLSMKDLWFDSIALSGQWEEIFSDSGVWKEREISTGVSLKKSLGIFNAGLDLTGGFVNAADSSDNESNVGMKIWGGISL